MSLNGPIASILLYHFFNQNPAWPLKLIFIVKPAGSHVVLGSLHII